MKRILSLLLSAMLLLSISFTTFAESNVITTNIQTLEKSDEKCVVKETRTDSIIISLLYTGRLVYNHSVN